MTPPQSWDLSYGGDFTWELGTIHDDGKAYHSSSYYHLYIPVSNLKGWKVYLKAKSTTNAVYTLLKNIGFAYPVRPLDISSYYCEGYSNIVNIPAGEAAEITIPDDCNYIYIGCGQTSGQYSYPPESGSYYIYKWHGAAIEIAKLDTYTIGDKIEPQMQNGYGIDTTGKKVAENIVSCSDYIPLKGGKYIRLTKPLLGSMRFVIAFYSYQVEPTFISSVSLLEYDPVETYKIEDIEIPTDANFMRITGYASTISRHFDVWYRLIYGSNDLFKDAASSQIATQIMRSCKSISQGVLPNNLVTNFAFSATMQIIGSYAYVNYIAGNTLNGDSPTPSDATIGCLAKISLETNEVIETLHPSIANYYDDDGNAVQGYRSNASILMKNKNGQLGYFGQMVVPNSKDPVVAVAGFGTPSSLVGNSMRMCKLQYTVNGVEHIVRFSIENYRQMLVDMGYVSTYYAPVYDGFDNNCIIYDSASDKYYDLIGTVSSGGFSLPLILLESADMSTWSLKARIGTQLWKANEIKGVIKDGKLYASFREVKTTNALNWIVYDIGNDIVVSSGTFNTGYVTSRPYTFIFNNNIYMVINMTPSVYGSITNTYYNVDDMRTEVNIYKIVNDVPVFMRRVCNPTGLNYHCWEEIPPYTAPNNTSPMTAYGGVYCAFSEDRRLLFRRMFSQVSFGDVTALFADNRRIG